MTGRGTSAAAGSCPGKDHLERVRDAVADYYAAFVERMSLDEASCPSLFRFGASQVIEELYGTRTAEELEQVQGVSLGCGNPLSAAALATGQVVLDLGCGLGLDCLLAAKAVVSSGRVVGIDLVDDMVKRALLTARSAGQDNAGFVRCAMESVPLSSGSVDVVISNCAVNLSADKRAVLSEAARLLKPGGRLVVYDILSDAVVPDEVCSDLGRWAGCVGGVLTAEQYVRHLNRAGLVEARVREAGSAEGLLERVPGAPRLYVGEITARRQ